MNQKKNTSNDDFESQSYSDDFYQNSELNKFPSSNNISLSQNIISNNVNESILGVGNSINNSLFNSSYLNIFNLFKSWSFNKVSIDTFKIN